ncbi:LysM peptidoglycan-binding domain-containing protein [Pseudomonas gingeri]|uniref:LysM peptidoglycan-binding domain-containing protein n=1 Tax=Pseudomonas gingeri TaxID=117681 RepID=UPI0015A48347|nr:LysM peptidoglycan-binding domain-containing protein [Pseudomonas gingeri]NWA28701.1 LysM peptidoglycan-binding domain-containing protein [Pseudomonas gingeri]
MSLLDTLKNLLHPQPTADKPPDNPWQVPPVEDPLVSVPLFDTYTVQPGDTLSMIAEQKLHDAGRWPEIAEANRATVPDPNNIRPGQELKIPR